MANFHGKIFSLTKEIQCSSYKRQKAEGTLTYARTSYEVLQSSRLINNLTKMVEIPNKSKEKHGYLMYIQTMRILA